MSDFLSSLASGGVSALTNLGGSLLGTAFQSLVGPSWRTQARFQRDIQKELMSHQAELNRQQYDYEFQKEAEYNSPTAERTRLEAAGLNPALAYGGGASGSSGVQASVGSVSGGSVGQAKPLSLAENHLDLTSLAQIESMAAITRDRNADAAEKEYDLWRRKQMDADGAYDLDIEAKSNAVELQRQDIISRKEQNAILRVNRRIREATEANEIAMSDEELNRLIEEVANLRYRNMYEKARGENAVALITNELTMQLASISELYARTKMNLASAYERRMAGQNAGLDSVRIRAIAKIYENEQFISNLEKLAMAHDGDENGISDYVEAMEQEIRVALRDANWSENDIGHAVSWIMKTLGQLLSGAVETFIMKKFGGKK